MSRREAVERALALVRRWDAPSAVDACDKAFDVRVFGRNHHAPPRMYAGWLPPQLFSRTAEQLEAMLSEVGLP